MKKLFATATFLALAGGAAADGTIIDQVHDFEGGLSSERNTAVDLATTADDFFTTSKSIMGVLSATFLEEKKNPLIDWEFLIYENDNGIPGKILASQNGGIAEDTGDDSFGRNVVVVSFDEVNIQLMPDAQYWLAVRGIGNGDGSAFWGTANFGDPNGSDAMIKSDFFGIPDWTPWEMFLASPTDVAFTMTLIPTPGALALLPLSAMLMSRRRRPSTHGEVR